jgi:hypothetical protein
MPITVGQYADTLSSLMEGEIAMMGVTTDQLSAVNALGLILPFGRAVVQAPGSTGIHEKNLVTLPTAAAQVIRGISVATDTVSRYLDANGNAGYAPAGVSATMVPSVMSIVTKGMIWVKALEAVIKGDPVTTRITVGATQGQFGKTTDAANIACPISWEWYSTVAVNGFGLIYLK